MARIRAMNDWLAKLQSPEKKALWFFSLVVAGATFLFGLVTGTDGMVSFFMAIGAFLMAMWGLRLGLLLICTLIILSIFQSRSEGYFYLALPWIFLLSLLSSAYFRAILVNTGVSQKGRELYVPRPVVDDPEIRTDADEGYRLWAMELVLSSVLLTLIYCLVFGVAMVISWTSTDTMNLPNQKLAIGVLGMIMALMALGHFVFTLLNMRRTSKLEAALTIMATLHRELRSELVFFTRFRAKKRW
jgi:hypothetical protein